MLANLKKLFIKHKTKINLGVNFKVIPALTNRKAAYLRLLFLVLKRDKSLTNAYTLGGRYSDKLTSLVKLSQISQRNKL